MQDIKCRIDKIYKRYTEGLIASYECLVDIHYLVEEELKDMFKKDLERLEYIGGVFNLKIEVRD